MSKFTLDHCFLTVIKYDCKDLDYCRRRKAINDVGGLRVFVPSYKIHVYISR